MAEPVPRYSNNDGTEDFGDFVKDEDEADDLEYITEGYNNYYPKAKYAFYPVRLGDVISERYLVEHKLGFGGFSTVWMAHDLQENRNVALKIMCAGECGDSETRIQDEIVRSMSPEDASQFVTYLTTFLLQGNGCHHKVQVLPIIGPSLDPYIPTEIPMASRMSAARQLLEALEKLHKVGIAHCDLNGRNCMWGMAPLNNLSRSAKYEAFGRPLREIIPIDNMWKQGELVRSMEVPEKLRTDRFYLGDFCLAKKPDDPITSGAMPPLAYCSPERLHGMDPSPACDMWSYMVLFSELYLGYPLFATRLLGGGIRHRQVQILGSYPEHWKSRCCISPDALDHWYDQSKNKKPTNGLASTIALFRPDIDPIEREHVRFIMSRVFVYNTEERLTATQLLQDPSFRTVMKNHGC